jgi:hypothetical protein
MRVKPTATLDSLDSLDSLLLTTLPSTCYPVLEI